MPIRCIVTSQVGAAMLVIAAVLFPIQTRAETRSISFPPGAAEGEHASSSIQVDAPGGFSLTFVLPLDYEKNTAVKVVLYLNAENPPCATVLATEDFGRVRPGRRPAGNFLNVSGASSVSFPADNTTARQIFVIRRGGELQKLLPGDGLQLVITRNGNPPDTCSGPIFVDAINILYTAAPPAP